MSVDLDFCSPVFLKPPSPTALHCICHHGLLVSLCFVSTKPPRNHLKEFLPATWILETLQRLPVRFKRGQGCLTWYPTSQLHSPTFPGHLLHPPTCSVTGSCSTSIKVSLILYLCLHSHHPSLGNVISPVGFLTKVRWRSNSNVSSSEVEKHLGGYQTYL